MADWDAFRSELEGAETRQPPLGQLRERHRRRRQRRTIAATLSVVMVGSAGGLALLGESGKPGSGPPPNVSALNPIVGSTKLPPPPDYKDYVVTDVDFVSPTTGWALGLRCVGDACDVATFRTDDAGSTWSAPAPVATAVPRSTYHEEDPSGGAVRSIRMLDASTGYAYNPDLYVTRDGARTWQRLARTSKVTSVSYAGTSVWVTHRGCPAAVDCDVVVEAGTAGGALSPLDVPETDAALALVRRGSEHDGYLVAWNAPRGERASFWRTTDGGRTWSRGMMPCPDAGAVSLSARGGLWLVCTVGDERFAYVSDDGTSWTRTASPPAEGVVTDLLGTATSAYLTTQRPGALYEFDPAGKEWRRVEVDKGYGYGNLDAVDGEHVFAMGDAGELWRTADGLSWNDVALPPGAPRAAATPPRPRGLGEPGVRWTGVSFLDTKRGWAIGERCADLTCRPVLRRTADGGETWQPATAPATTWDDTPEVQRRRVTLVVFADDRNGWLYWPGLYETHDGGATWTERHDAGYPSLEVTGSTLWAGAFQGCGGQPCHPSLLRGAVAGGPFDEVHEPVGEGSAFDAVDANEAYLLGDDGAVATRDGGRTWTPVQRPCTVGSVSAWAPGRLWAICAGADDKAAQSQAVSTDGGRTWTVSPLPGTGLTTGRIVAFSDTYAWRTGANRGVLVTRDGGRTWDAAPNVGTPVSSFRFVDGEHGWLVAGGVLYRTTDGATWERLG